MNLRCIYLGSDFTFPKEFWTTFCYNTRFITHWMSRNVRKLKISTDGTFKQLSVLISRDEDHSKQDIMEDFYTTIQWTDADVEKYLAMKDEKERIQLYLSILRDGLSRISIVKEIPIDRLFALIDTFEQNGCKHEWQFKSMYLKDWGVRLKFTCHFTTYDFQLRLTLFNKQKKVIVSKSVFRIYPDENWYWKDLRKVVVEGDKLYINDSLNEHFLMFDLNKLQQGIIEETLLNENKKQFLYEANVEKYKRIQWLL